MAQILDLSKRFTQSQVEEAIKNDSKFNDIEAGGYVCKIVDAILNDSADGNKANIELNVDIAEGKYQGYFQSLEDRAGFWGLKGYMSFKESQIGKFTKTCQTIAESNPGYSFNPMAPGGADIDTLKGKLIGVVIQKQEYMSNAGELREKNAVYNITEVSKIREGKFKVPAVKKLDQTNYTPTLTAGTDDLVPFN